MKEIVEYMSCKKVIFKKLKEIKPKELGSKKRVKIYLGVNLKGYYCLTIIISKKSRILRKEVLELIELHQRVEKYNNSKINIKYIIIEAPLCSHAKDKLKDNGWIVWKEDIR